jgi:hypothetical protein
MSLRNCEPKRIVTELLAIPDGRGKVGHVSELWDGRANARERNWQQQYAELSISEGGSTR